MRPTLLHKPWKSIGTLTLSIYWHQTTTIDSLTHFMLFLRPREGKLLGPVSKWSLRQDLLLKLRHVNDSGSRFLSLSSKSCLKLHLETGPWNSRIVSFVGWLWTWRGYSDPSCFCHWTTMSMTIVVSGGPPPPAFPPPPALSHRTFPPPRPLPPPVKFPPGHFPPGHFPPVPLPTRPSPRILYTIKNSGIHIIKRRIKNTANGLEKIMHNSPPPRSYTPLRIQESTLLKGELRIPQMVLKK